MPMEKGKVHIRIVRNCLVLCCVFSSFGFAQNTSQNEPKQSVELGADLTSSPILSSSDTESEAQDATPASDPQAGGNGSGTRSKGSTGGTTAPASPAGTAPTSTAYVYPSSGEMTRYWLRNTVGLKGWVGAAFTGAWNTWVRESPDEWGLGARGWSHRLGSSLLDNGINTSTLVLWSRAMGQDPRYYRCECSGTWPRARHAFESSFLARNRSGSRVFSPARMISPFAGPMVTRNTIYPDRFDFSNAAASGAYYLIGSVGWNLIREFIGKKAIF